jgi:glutaredoxin
MRKHAVWLLLIICTDGAWATEFYRWVDKSGAIHYSDQMPTGHVNKLEQRKLEPNVIDGQASYVMKDAAIKNPVILFGADCGPLCSNAKALLEKRGIPYELKDPQKVKKDAEALNALTGAMELPVIKVGKEMIKGFEPNQWNAMLNDAGYPKSKIPGASRKDDKLPPLPPAPHE